ncbi:MAG: GGDEF domain-containing protein [Actinomycetota bacterium]|nr:GGDEF domain-containing protein [Actinomycetota bacterium]
MPVEIPSHGISIVDTGLVDVQGRPGGHRATGRREVVDTIFSPRRTAQLAAASWGIVAATALALAVVPHGTGVRLWGWLVFGVLASGLAASWHWKGEQLTRPAQFAISLGGLLGVGGAIACAHGVPTAFAVAPMYITLTVYAASFFPSRALLVHLVVLAASSGAALLSSAVPGAAAEWVATVFTTLAVSGCIRALVHAMSRAASTDPLTGLANRRSFEPLLERELARCLRFGHPLCVAVLDLDGFKHVNDTLGHHGGDRVLVETTAAWRSALRTFDVLARSGGDEFLLLLPSTSADAAAAVLGRLRRLHDQRFSAGVAEAEPGDTSSGLLRRADAACYRAKEQGRNRTVVAGTTAAGRAPGAGRLRMPDGPFSRRVASE